MEALGSADIDGDPKGERAGANESIGRRLLAYPAVASQLVK